MFLRLNVLVFLVLVLCGLSCSSNDEFTRKRRIPYHLPGFWYHFLPKPLEDEPEAVFEAEDSSYNLPADGTLFGWDRRKKLNL